MMRPSSSGSGGAIELGLHRELVERRELRVSELLPLPPAEAVARYPAEVSVVASLQGPPDRPVRDAVLRQILDS